MKEFTGAIDCFDTRLFFVSFFFYEVYPEVVDVKLAVSKPRFGR